jgi:outer membrane protein W
MRQTALLSTILAGTLLATPASAQPGEERDTFARIGIAHINLADKGPVFVNGTRDPSADYRTDKDWIGSIEIGHYVLRNVAVRAAVTTPAETYNIPAGSLAGTPNLFNDTSSNFTLTATWHPLRGQTFSPYIGGGIGLNKIFDTEEKLATDVTISDSHGPVLQGGVEFDLNDRFGLYFDAKKAWWSADASGFLGALRVTAEAELDPVILQAGALIRF